MRERVCGIGSGIYIYICIRVSINLVALPSVMKVD